MLLTNKEEHKIYECDECKGCSEKYVSFNQGKTNVCLPCLNKACELEEKNKEISFGEVLRKLVRLIEIQFNHSISDPMGVEIKHCFHAGEEDIETLLESCKKEFDITISQEKVDEFSSIEYRLTIIRLAKYIINNSEGN